MIDKVLQCARTERDAFIRDMVLSENGDFAQELRKPG